MNIYNNIKKPTILALTILLITPPSPAEEGVTGKLLYQAYCAQCHGLEGDGFGVNSYDIEVAPRNHTDTDEMMARTDEDLFKTIKEGGKSVNKSVLMPEWGGNLTDEEIHLLVDQLRELCCKGDE